MLPLQHSPKLSSDQIQEPVTNSQLQKPMDYIDISCADGETCYARGGRCSDGISGECFGKIFDSFVCECKANLTFSCWYNSACANPTCETAVDSTGDSR